MKEKLRLQIDKSVEILRRYRATAVKRKNMKAKAELEIIMRTLKVLHSLIFDISDKG
jgi:hypothetical protein